MSVAGKNRVIAKLTTIITEEDFIPFLVTIQNKIIINPEAKSLGCIKVSKPKITEFIVRYCTNFLSFFSTKSFTTIASAIMKPDAVKLSNPTEFAGLALMQTLSVKEMISKQIKNKISKVELTDLR